MGKHVSCPSSLFSGIVSYGVQLCNSILRPVRPATRDRPYYTRVFSVSGRACYEKQMHNYLFFYIGIGGARQGALPVGYSRADPCGWPEAVVSRSLFPIRIQDDPYLNPTGQFGVFLEEMLHIASHCRTFTLVCLSKSLSQLFLSCI